MSEVVQDETGGLTDLENAEERANKEDFFVDYVEKDDDDSEGETATIEEKDKKKSDAYKNNSKLPPKGLPKDFAKKTKQILREGVKHVTKATIAGQSLSKSMSEKDQKQQTKLMQSLMKEDREMQLKRLEKFRREEEEKANRVDLKKAERMVGEEKKWQKEVVGKVDLVPEDPHYYDKLAIKPGFDFFYALINCEHLLHLLRVNIPDILFFNYNSYLIKTDNEGKISIKMTPKSEEYLKLIENKSKYDIVKFWTEPATVVRKATNNPCYTSIQLLNWKQTYEHIRNGPENRSMIQKYQKSQGDRHTMYRTVVHAEDVINQKGAGKYNFAYALANKTPFKVAINDEMDRSLEEQRDGEVYVDSSTVKMEQRFLTCPFDVGSFDVYTYTGKTMDRLEKEAYKVFEFLQKAFELRLYYLVTDWMRDDKGVYWFISLKSYKLKSDNYIHKTLKPSAIDRELLAINQHKKVNKVSCSRCYQKHKPTEIEQNKLTWAEFFPMSKSPSIKETLWCQQILKKRKATQIDEVFFCDTCYDLLMRDHKGFEYIPKKLTEPKEMLAKQRQNAQRFRPKMYQWRMLILAQKILDVDKDLLDSKGIPIYLQCSFGEYVTRFQITDHGAPLHIATEKVTSHVKIRNNQKEIVSDSEPISFDELYNLPEHEKVHIVKINKARINYFFTENVRNLQQFLNSCEIEFRITFGPNWNNYLAASKGNFLNYFSNMTFQRGSEAHYSRNLQIFTDELVGINLKFSIGLQLDQELDMSEFSDSDLKKYMGVIYLPPENYFSQYVCHNVIPPTWFSMIKEEDTIVKQKAADIGLKLYAPDGRPYTKLELEKMAKYGHVQSKLFNATVANRAGGKEELVDHLNGSLHVSKRRNLSIPQQIAEQMKQKKTKITKKQYVVPSMKAAFYKKHKLGQNIRAMNDGLDKNESDLNTSAGSQISENKKQRRLQFRDIFAEEGISSSIGQKVRRASHHLVQLAGKLKTDSEDEDYMENEAKYNRNLFDMEAIKKIELENQKNLNPYSSKVQEKLNEEKKQNDEIEKAAMMARQRGSRQFTQKRKDRIQRVERVDNKQKLLEQKEQLKKQNEELEERNKIREEIKFRQLKLSMSNDILKNIRSVNYGNFTTL